MTDPTPFQTDGARAKLYAPGPTWNGAPAAMVGNWSCSDPKAGADLLAEIIAEARQRGYAALLGPMDGDTWHSYRLVTDSDGSKPFLMEPSLTGLDPWEATGFTPAAQYFSARSPVPNTPPRATEVEIRAWDGSDPDAHFGQVYDLSIQAFSKNLFYTPISREAFVAMYMPFVPMLRPEFVLFAFLEGQLQGFLFGVPNYSDGPQTQTIILKTYAGLVPGVGRALVERFFFDAAQAGFTQAIHALIHDDNRSAERSRQAGGTIFRRYCLMGLAL